MEAKLVSGGATIGEVARRAGLRPSALRYYERIGLLQAPGRENGRRRYNGEVMRERVLLSLRETSFYDLPQIEVSRKAGSTPRPPARCLLAPVASPFGSSGL